MRPWYYVHAWGQAVRLARRRWPRIPLWAWARAGCIETDRGEYEPVTPAEAGRIASDVLLALAEQARAAEVVTVRRNRDVPGWDGGGRFSNPSRFHVDFPRGAPVRTLQ